MFAQTACRTENRRDDPPDHPNRSRHNRDIPEGSKYTIPARKDADTGSLPAGATTYRDSIQHRNDSTNRNQIKTK